MHLGAVVSDAPKCITYNLLLILAHEYAMPMSHFLVRPRRAAATSTNAAIDASRRGANVNF